MEMDMTARILNSRQVRFIVVAVRPTSGETTTAEVEVLGGERQRRVGLMSLPREKEGQIGGRRILSRAEGGERDPSACGQSEHGARGVTSPYDGTSSTFHVAAASRRGVPAAPEKSTQHHHATTCIIKSPSVRRAARSCSSLRLLTGPSACSNSASYFGAFVPACAARVVRGGRCISAE